MKRIVICADDYALAPGVSKAIRALAAAGRLNATTVMVAVPGVAAEAVALAMTEMPRKLQIGLHVTLSGSFKPLAAPPLPTLDGDFPPLANLLDPMASLRIDRAAVEREVTAQMHAFVEAFKRTPDFVDGHQHVQLLPGVRDGFLKVVARDAPGAWVRQCGPADWRSALAGGAKTAFLAWLSRGFRRRAVQAGLQFNPAFAGAYDFKSDREFGELFARFLAELPDGGLLMCHPGHVDDVLIARDPLTERREAEYAFLAGEKFPQALAAAGAALA